MQSSNDLNQLIIDAISLALGMIQFSPDGIVLDANKNFLNVLGYTLEEVKGKHHSMFVEPDYARSGEYRDFWASLGRGESQVAEFKRLGKGGREVWINASYNAVKDNSGQVIRVVKTAADITAEVERRKEIAILSLVANETQNSVIITDKNERIEFVNPGFTRMTGYTEDQAIGKRPGELLQGPLTCKNTKAEIREAIKNSKSIYTEILNYHSNGDTYWVSLAINPILAKDGTVERFVSIQSNVSAVKEKALEASSQIEAIGRSQAMIEFKIDGTVLSANKNFLDFMGYRLEDIVGRHHRMFVDPAEASSAAYTSLWEKLNRGEFDSRVFKRIARDGRVVWMQGSYNPILDTTGRPVKVVKYATDVSKIIETGQIAEETVASTQSVAAAVEQMTASIGEISHSMQLTKDAAILIMSDTNQSSTEADQLTNSMKSMENVVQLISNIASQVKLLALNATIEAARAGEAGRGFAVVAAEVKSLATQTESATSQITREILEVQTVADNVSKSIRNIAGSAENVSQYVSGVASAIEEQSVTTREMSASTQRMSNSVGDIAQRIKRLSAVA